jgi:hypothetical protein
MSVNDITGDILKTKSSTPSYISGWDLIWGKDKGSTCNPIESVKNAIDAKIKWCEEQPSSGTLTNPEVANRAFEGVFSDILSLPHEDRMAALLAEDDLEECECDGLCTGDCNEN